MSKDKPSLGTGLDSLLGERPKADSQGVSKIAIEDLSPGQYQPRKKMYKSTLEELHLRPTDRKLKISRFSSQKDALITRNPYWKEQDRSATNI